MNEKISNRSKITILLSINAATILIAGVLIAGAIWVNDRPGFRAVDERSDIIAGGIEQLNPVEVASDSGEKSLSVAVTDFIPTSSHDFDSSAVPDGELWNEKSITIYATPDIDICVGGSLTGLGEMYWQTSDSNIIAGFYDTARTWLGYDNNTCRYPVIKGVGTVTITAGTYDGTRKDSIVVNVVNPPIEQWEHEVLSAVNKLRVKNGLNQLTWGYTCEEAAQTRATEAKELYSHTRPDGTSWSTACPVPNSGGESGENLAIGNAAVSPSTVVALWMGSDSHRANILNPDFTKLSVGFVFDPDTNYRTYWSQFFSTY